jgi:hypothetical protein
LFTLVFLQSFDTGSQNSRNFLHALLASHIGGITGANRHGKNLLILFFPSGMPTLKKTTMTSQKSLKFVRQQSLSVSKHSLQFALQIKVLARRRHTRNVSRKRKRNRLN